MLPPLFATLNVPSVKAVLGTPLRVYAFGEGKQNGAKPYVVWQVIPGSAPENFLAGAPDCDRFVVQLDVYGDDMDAVLDAAPVVRDAVEATAYVTSYNGSYREPDTRLYRYSFTVEFLTRR